MHEAYRSAMAERMGCQKSFFSQVLNTHVHLSPDHTVALAEFWSFNDEESSYFLDLVLLARAGASAMKNFLKRRMKQTRENRGDPTARFKQPQWLNASSEQLHYSSWYWSAIHVMVSTPKYKTAEAIAERLRLTLPLVEQALKSLTEMKLIKKVKGRYEVAESLLHLPNTSLLNEMHQTHWRNKAIQNLQAQDHSALHYSAVFALSESDAIVLKEKIVEHIQSLHGVIAPSPSEEVFCINCDLFRLP